MSTAAGLTCAGAGEGDGETGSLMVAAGAGDADTATGLVEGDLLMAGEGLLRVVSGAGLEDLMVGAGLGLAAVVGLPAVNAGLTC